MSIKLCAVGGYSEIGKNMTALKIDNEAVILDCGIFLPKLLDFEEEGGLRKNLTREGLISIGAIPNDSIIDSWKDKVNVIASTHCHLDHIAAIPYNGNRYNCPVIGTPFTCEVLKSILIDENLKLINPIKPLNPGSSYKISKNIKIEFINITHSTLQTVMIAVHTPEGVIIYANDFKFDNHPVLGKAPDYNRLKKIAQDHEIIALVVDSLYADSQSKTPSEKVAREMLKDVMLGTNNEGHAIIATTFASHLARLRSIIDFGKKLDRKIVFLGRSLKKYSSAAENIDLVKYSKEVEIYGYRNQIEKALKRIEKNREDYLIICTGNQAEPRSTLVRMANGDLPFKFLPEDHIIFSCKTIPVDVNIANRTLLERKLRQKKVRIFTDIHTSVLPDTEVVFNDYKSMKIKKIKEVENIKELRVPAFNPSNLKIRWYKANLIKHYYKGKIFNIKTKTGRNAEITSGHSVFILKNGRITEIKGDDLNIGDYIAIPKKFQWDKKIKQIDILDSIKVKKSLFNRFSYDNKWIYYAKRKISPRKIKLTKNFGKLLGYYLAEGCAPRHIAITFGSREKELIDELCKAIKNVFPSRIKLIDKGTAISVQFGANILKNTFKTWFGGNAREKRIPDFIFSASEEFKLVFLGAYINGDGHLEEDKKKCCRIRIKTASKKLASDLIYLFSQLGVCAKFDHKETIPARIINGHKQRSLESICYVIRIQGKDPMIKIKNYLKKSFKKRIIKHINLKISNSSTTPDALPIKHINWNDIICKKNTYLKELQCQDRKEKHIGLKILKRDSLKINGETRKVVDGDLQFDPIVKIEVKDYSGDVYDFSVPGAENFIGGFGGIILHNSGHCCREDLRDLIDMLKPKNIIPAHGGPIKENALAELAKEMGYQEGKNVHVMHDSQSIDLK